MSSAIADFAFSDELSMKFSSSGDWTMIYHTARDPFSTSWQLDLSKFLLVWRLLRDDHAAAAVVPKTSITSRRGVSQHAADSPVFERKAYCSPTSQLER